MKRIVEYINESSKHRKSAPRHFDAEDITGPLTPAVDYDGNNCIIIGKPFTNERDEAYLVDKELIKKIGYKNIAMDLEYLYNELPEAEDAEYFVFATNGHEVSCFVYGDSGVVGVE